MKHQLYVTPLSRRSLMLAGRGNQALQEGQAWQFKVTGLAFGGLHLLGLPIL